MRAILLLLAAVLVAEAIPDTAHAGAVTLNDSRDRDRRAIREFLAAEAPRLRRLEIRAAFLQAQADCLTGEMRRARDEADAFRPAACAPDRVIERMGRPPAAR